MFWIIWNDLLFRIFGLYDQLETAHCVPTESREKVGFTILIVKLKIKKLY